MRTNLSQLHALTAISLIVASIPALAQTAATGDSGTVPAPIVTTTTDGASAAQGSTGADTGANTASASTDGAFASLSPGGQKIARALFESQKQPVVTDGTAATADGGGGVQQPATRSLDDIAAAKAAGTGWGRIFMEMKAEGLVTERNLGQVISNANRRDRLGDNDGSAGQPATDTGPGTSGETNVGGTAAGAVSTVPAARHGHSASSPGGRHTPVTVTLANGATVVVGGNGNGRGNALRGDAAADSVEAGAGISHGHREVFDAAGGHGGRGIVSAPSAAKHDFSVLLGSGATAGNSGNGAVAASAGASRATHDGGRGAGRGRAR